MSEFFANLYIVLDLDIIYIFASDIVLHYQNNTTATDNDITATTVKHITVCNWKMMWGHIKSADKYDENYNCENIFNNLFYYMMKKITLLIVSLLLLTGGGNGTAGCFAGWSQDTKS